MNKRSAIRQFLHHRCLLMSICAITDSAFAWDFVKYCKIGDRAMSLPPRYLVESGVFPNEVVADSASLQIPDTSHMPSSNAYAMNELTQLPNIVTYGTLCGLTDGHVENPMPLEIGPQIHFSKANRTPALETQAMNEFLTGANSKELFGINLAHNILAIKGFSHFHAYGKRLNEHPKMTDPELIRHLQCLSRVNEVFDKLDQLPSMSKYFCIHIFIIYLAQKAGRETCKGDTRTANDPMFYATTYGAFTEHFLQDSFISGHQMVREGFSAFAVSSNKSLHDFYSTIPVQTTNLKGETWSAYDNKHLN